MMLSWREKRSVTIDEFVQSNEYWSSLYEMDIGLTKEDFKLLVTDLGLTAHAPQGFRISAYGDMLAKHGPLWVIAASGAGIGSHARILVGYRGDGSPDNTCFELIDPATGELIQENAMGVHGKFRKRGALNIEVV